MHKAFDLRHRDNPINFIGRYVTAPWRSLPDFVILGAQKSGTRSLFEYINQHPEVLPCKKKEVHFFDSKVNKGLLWYKSYFPLKYKKERKNALTGEASPSYLFYPGVAQRLHDYLPRAKFIVLLRNPVERTVSSYYQQKRKNNEPLSMQEALLHEEERLERLQRELQHKKLFRKKHSKALREAAYKTRGLYAQQLRQYFSLFDQKQFFIESAENFFRAPELVLRNIFQFLDIEKNFVPADLKAKNVHEYPDAPDEVLQELRKYFTKPNEELFSLLGRRFDW